MSETKQSPYIVAWDFNAKQHVTLSKQQPKDQSGTASSVELFFIKNAKNPMMPVNIELPAGNFVQNVRPVEDIYKRNRSTSANVINEGVPVDKYTAANFQINPSLLPEGAPVVEDIYKNLNAEMSIIIDMMLSTYADTSDLSNKRFNPVQLNKKNKRTGSVYPPSISCRVYLTFAENENIHSLKTAYLDILCINYDPVKEQLAEKGYIGCREIARTSTVQPVIRLTHAFVSPIGIGICAKLTHVVIHISPNTCNEFSLNMLPSSSSTVSVKKRVMPKSESVKDTGSDPDEKSADENCQSPKRQKTVIDAPVSPTM
jgi:hypothetical protein